MYFYRNPIGSIHTVIKIGIIILLTLFTHVIRRKTMQFNLKPYLRLAALSCLLFTSSYCSKDETNTPVTPNDADQYFWIHMGSDSTKIMFSALPAFNADGEQAVQLSSFIDTLLVPMYHDKNGIGYDARALYSYQIVGEDGFSASKNRGYPNNIWEQLKLGHVMKSSRQVIFPDAKIDLAGAYDVKKARHIYIYRKIDITVADSTKFVELQAISPVQVTNSGGTLENAIPLSAVISALLPVPGALKFNMLSLDGYGPTATMTWVQMQTGYWLLTSQATLFTDATLTGGRYKLKVLQKLTATP
jgi:hypothetical protein